MACRNISLTGIVARIGTALSFVHLVGTDDGGTGKPSKEQGGFDWRKAIVDGLIVAGLNFVSTLGGISITHIIADPLSALLASLISAGQGFFITLAFKRGLIHRPSPE